MMGSDPTRLARRCARWVAGAILMVAAGSARAGTTEGYAITIDGSASQTEVVPIETASAADAVAVAINSVFLEPRCLVLGAPGRYAFTFEGDTGHGPTRGYLTRPGEKRRLVWIRIWKPEVGRRKVLDDPLRRLSPTEIKELRGIHVDTWSEAIAAEVARLDLTRVCLSTEARPTVPNFPAGVRYLAISPVYKPDLSGLRRFGQLVFLTLNTYEDPFDAAWVGTLTNLQVLTIAAGTIENADRLQALHAVRELKLRARKGIEKLEFLPAMPALRRLFVSGPVDLTPVRELHNLVELGAAGSPAMRLPPARLPALRKVDVMSTRVTDAEVERFRALNPNAVVRHRWTPLLRAALLGATELEVEVVRVRREDPQRSVVVRDGADIAKLVAALEIDDPPNLTYACLPTHVLTFKRPGGPPDGEVIELAHGSDIRWAGFPGDGPLTAASLTEVRAWLERHGVGSPGCGDSKK